MSRTSSPSCPQFHSHYPSVSTIPPTLTFLPNLFHLHKHCNAPSGCPLTYNNPEMSPLAESAHGGPCAETASYLLCRLLNARLTDCLLITHFTHCLERGVTNLMSCAHNCIPCKCEYLLLWISSTRVCMSSTHVWIISTHFINIIYLLI